MKMSFPFEWGSDDDDDDDDEVGLAIVTWPKYIWKNGRLHVMTSNKVHGVHMVRGDPLCF